MDLSSVGFDLLVQLCLVSLHGCDLWSQIFRVKSTELLIESDLLIVVGWRFFKPIVFLVQFVNVVEELNVLLFSFDEGCDDFVDVIYSRSLHDSLKGFLNNLCVPHILVQQALLLNVLVDCWVQPDSQDLDWVGEFLFWSLALFGLHRAWKTFVVVLYVLVFLLELLLQTLDVSLEGLFTFLMLALESKDLIVCLWSLAWGRETLLVRGSRILSQLLDGFLHATDTVLSENDLVAHARDSDHQVFIITLDVVQEDFLMLQLVLQRFQIRFFLIFCFHLLGVRVETIVELSSLYSVLLLLLRNVLSILALVLGFANFLVDFRLDFLQLLLGLPVVVRENHKLLSLVLQ